MMVPRPEEQDKLKIIHIDHSQKMPECQEYGKARLPKVLAVKGIADKPWVLQIREQNSIVSNLTFQCWTYRHSIKTNEGRGLGM